MRFFEFFYLTFSSTAPHMNKLASFIFQSTQNLFQVVAWPRGVVLCVCVCVSGLCARVRIHVHARLLGSNSALSWRVLGILGCVPSTRGDACTYACNDVLQSQPVTGALSPASHCEARCRTRRVGLAALPFAGCWGAGGGEPGATRTGAWGPPHWRRPST